MLFSVHHQHLLPAQEDCTRLKLVCFVSVGPISQLDLESADRPETAGLVISHLRQLLKMFLWSVGPSAVWNPFNCSLDILFLCSFVETDSTIHINAGAVTPLPAWRVVAWKYDIWWQEIYGDFQDFLSQKNGNAVLVSSNQIWTLLTAQVIRWCCRQHLTDRVVIVTLTGLSDIPGEAMVKLYCPKCQDVYIPKSSRHHHTDGAYFGTGFPHMLFMVHPEYRPKRPANQFTARLDNSSPNSGRKQCSQFYWKIG